MNRSLPLLRAGSPTPALPLPLPLPELLAELQSLGLRWTGDAGAGLARRGGAGPSDHKAISVGDQTIMVPIFTHAAGRSPYAARVKSDGGRAVLERNGIPVYEISFPEEPRFYALRTADGTPYWKIARLHARDVLATTVLQTCTRYGNKATSCQFCAIGQSLAQRQTLSEKTPEQLAEVTQAAVRLDGVRHVVMTTGTPHTPDRGAAVLSACARAIRARVDVPIQGQCEPPADFGWFERMQGAGIDSLGMHLEAVTEAVRRRIMPGKAEVPLHTYFEAFAAAARVFGRALASGVRPSSERRANCLASPRRRSTARSRPRRLPAKRSSAGPPRDLESRAPALASQRDRRDTRSPHRNNRRARLLGSLCPATARQPAPAGARWRCRGPPLR